MSPGLYFLCGSQALTCLPPWKHGVLHHREGHDQPSSIQGSTTSRSCSLQMTVEMAPTWGYPWLHRGASWRGDLLIYALLQEVIPILRVILLEMLIWNSFPTLAEAINNIPRPWKAFRWPSPHWPLWLWMIELFLTSLWAKVKSAMANITCCTWINASGRVLRSMHKLENTTWLSKIDLNGLWLVFRLLFFQLVGYRPLVVVEVNSADWSHPVAWIVSLIKCCMRPLE